MDGGEIDAVKVSQDDFKRLQKLKRRAKRAERAARKKKQDKAVESESSASSEYKPVNLEDILQ